MNKLHNKPFRYLILGIGIGVLLGVSVMYIWQQQLRINIFKSSLDKIYSTISDNNAAHKDTIVVSNQQNTVSQNDHERSVSNNNRQAANTETGEDGESDRDTILPSTRVIEDGDVVVRDELLYTRSIKIDNYPVKKQDKVDSLLMEGPSVKKDKLIQVEFWKSPINYTGYRFANDKLVLFGIFEPSAVDVDFQNDTFILVYKNNPYPLRITDDFINLKFKQGNRK